MTPQDDSLGAPDTDGASLRARIRAYVDGELDEALRADMAAALAVDASLQAEVARERRLRETLATAYAPVLEEPVPEALQALLRPPQPAAAVVALTSANAARSRMPTSPPRRGLVLDGGWSRWGGMAACVVAGVLAGMLGHSLWSDARPQPALVQAPTADNGWLLQGAVAQALSQQLASEPVAQTGANAAGMAVGWSFQARDGAYCRTFTTQGIAPMGGLACHAPQGWRLQALAPAEPTGPGMRTASSPLPPAVLQAAEALRQGDTLDAAAETAARARGWRP